MQKITSLQAEIKHVQMNNEIAFPVFLYMFGDFGACQKTSVISQQALCRSNEDLKYCFCKCVTSKMNSGFKAI